MFGVESRESQYPSANRFHELRNSFRWNLVRVLRKLSPIPINKRPRRNTPSILEQLYSRDI